MQKESSIFDEHFLEEFSVRRRRLIPVELKIYVWLYMIVAGLISLRLFYYYAIYPWRYRIRYSDILGLLAESWIFIFFVLRFLSNLFLWLEKKRAVRLAVVSVVLSILLSGYFFIKELSSEEFQSTSVIVLICWLAIEVPYLVLLLKLKRPWETAIVPGKK